MTEPKKKEHFPYKWGMSMGEFYANFRDKKVTVTLLDGKAYAGLLVGVDQYEIFIRQDSGVLMLIPKHAIKFVATPKSSEETKG